MITYRQAKFDDVENIHKLLNDYAKEGLMLPRSRNAIYENLRDYIVAVQGSHLVGCGALHFVWDRLAEIRSLAIDPELKCEPRLVMACGACAAGGETYGSTYAIVGKAADVVPVDIAVPGCPPRPSAMIVALCAAADLLKERM